MPGERLLWSGRPDPARLRAVFAIWFFAVPWTAFALFWEAMALLPWLGSTHTPLGIQWSFGIIFPLFGLPFIGIGLKMLSMPSRYGEGRPDDLRPDRPAHRARNGGQEARERQRAVCANGAD